MKHTSAVPTYRYSVCYDAVSLQRSIVIAKVDLYMSKINTLLVGWFSLLGQPKISRTHSSLEVEVEVEVDLVEIEIGFCSKS